MTMTVVPVYQVKCQGCRRVFVWRPTSTEAEQPPSYHSKRCKENRRVWLKTLPPTRCPRPDKQVFVTHELAEAKCDEIGDDRLKPYRCVCGGLHIGNIPATIVRYEEA